MGQIELNSGGKGNNSMVDTPNQWANWGFRQSNLSRKGHGAIGAFFLTWWSYKTWAGPGGLSLGGLGAGTECDCNKGEICRDQNCNVSEGSITSFKTNLSLLKTTIM